MESKLKIENYLFLKIYIFFIGVTSDSVSAGRNSKFDLDDEWVDVDNTSDELQEIIV